MSIKRKFFSVVTLAAALFAFSAFVSAQDSSSKSDAPTSPAKEGRFGDRSFNKNRRGGEKGRHGGNIMRELRGLDLTEDQKTQIKSLMESNKTTFEPQREEMRNLMMKKRDGSISESEKARFSQLKNEMRASSEQMEISVKALLTPEQTAQLTQLKAERQQKMQERRQQRKERKRNGEMPEDN